ncbi:TAXI family TRAP transporter solute-binding subunit [Hoyosella sp. YIM 151337]|uniref:TAXI family TRAP transporter solute-binding subunit n=1 Tax=Hoyosella sp. YIM 151337 TaxID=2992742 RepID=UPI00223670D3|nr:TAXI family TRAP transporter solute-binding subunit [Hoyosella sp. YIM 151337]MCW4353824.1 TAXI family TRAP transporter solute-binding subunit [Hoyosella sp. YIM 151337]
MRTPHRKGGRFRGRAAAAILAAGALALSACAADSPGDLTLATGSTGGTYYPLGGEIASVWSSEIEGISVTATVGGASVENLRALDQGEVDLIMSVNATAADAVDGTGDFADQPLANPQNIRVLGNIYPEIVQIVTTAQSGIESIEDLRGKRVEMGPPGSATYVMAEQILRAYGIDPQTDLAATLDSGFGDAATNLGDGVVDAAFGILAAPTGSIEQLATSHDVVLLDISGPELEAILAENELLSAHEIPAGTYSGVDEPNATITSWATLYTTADLDEETAYELVRVMYEHGDRVQHSAAEDMVLENAVDGLGPIEMHPGAVRYYEEQGVTIP